MPVIGTGGPSGTEGLFEVVEQVVEGLDGGRVGGLFALHGGDDDLVAEGDPGNVGGLVGLGFGSCGGSCSGIEATIRPA